MNTRHYYLPTDKKALIRLVDDARRRNVTRDIEDNASGYASPSDLDPAEHLRTAISAIVSGMSTCRGIDQGSADCIAEGIAMIQEVELQLRS